MNETLTPGNDQLSEYGYARVAALKHVVKPTNVEHNVAQMLELALDVDSAGVDLAVFPELSITGYSCGDYFQNQTLLRRAQEGVLAFAEQTRDLSTAFTIGFPLAIDNDLYNCAALIQGGVIHGIVPKMHIPNYNEFYEARQFQSGEELDRTITLGDQEVLVSMRQTFDIGVAKVGIEICEDMWQTGAPNDQLAQSGANLIVNLSASPELVNKAPWRETLIAGTAGRLACAYVCASAGVEESTADVVMAGSAIINSNGATLAKSTLFIRGNTKLVADVDISHLMHDRRTMNTARNSARPYVCHKIGKNALADTRPERNLLFAPAAFPFVPKNKEAMNETCELILNIQAHGLVTRLETLPVDDRKIVIGLSGGLDSTLAFLAAVKACDIMGVGYGNIHTVTMPGLGSSPDSQRNAEELATAFGTTHREVSIAEISELQLRMLDHPLDEYDTTYENTQARLRTLNLFCTANYQKGLVLGTGDLSELALGWCTYNGDHMSSYNVNGSIPKTLVKYLVQWASQQPYVTTRGADEPIRSILGRRYSPELIPAVDGKIQDTEDTVGDYALHDFFIYYFNRHGDEPAKIAYLAERAFEGTYDRKEILETMLKFFTYWGNNQWKRNVATDGPKVGTVAFSPRGDLRLPPEADLKLWKSIIQEELDALVLQNKVQ